MWVITTCVLLLAVICTITGQQVTVFTSIPQNVAVPSGAPVTLQCRISNRGIHSVKWYFVDHNLLQLSNNYEILTDDVDHRYSISTFPADAWDLTITNVQPLDHGHYRCAIPTLNLEQVSTVTVLDNPREPIPVNVPHTNFTECCDTHNVSPDCMAPCDPATINVDEFDATESCMTTDLVPLIICGSDGRNHAPCCYRRGIPDHCIPFCANLLTTELMSIVHTDAAYDECLAVSVDIVACFEEGQIYLPGPPSQVYVTPSSVSAAVRWSVPIENAGLITHYKVFYRIVTATEYRHSSALESSVLGYTISGLNPLTQYEAYVVAIGAHGSSLHSVMPVFRTLANEAGPIETRVMNACCREMGVSEDCIPIMCTAIPTQYSNGDSMTCLGQYDKVFTCIAERRNHTGCCISRGIPELCHPLCAGSPGGMRSSADTMDCMTHHIDQINACFEEGSTTIPGAVTQVKIDQVTASTARIGYNPPFGTHDIVESYRIIYRHQNAQGALIENHREAGQDLYALLVGLAPNTKYTAYVVSIGARGTSLPSASIRFRTYFLNGQVVPVLPPLPPVQPVLPANLQECCSTEGVPPECLDMCDYDVDYGTFGTSQLMTCIEYIPKMLMCGADGVNHTSCCLHEGVEDKCQQFCAFDRETAEGFTFTIAYISCIDDLNDIRSCMHRGLSQRPMPPSEFQLVSHDEATITLSWVRPTNIPSEQITGYTVHWREYHAPNDATYTTWRIVRVPASQQGYILNGLKSDTVYSVKVMTSTESESSLASTTLDIRTLPGESDPPTFLPSFNFTSPADVTACCETSAVSDKCMPACGGTTTHIHDCGSEIGKVMRCVGDERDHSTCCTRYNVPDSCMPLCRGGSSEAPDLMAIACLTYAEEILTCMSVGYDTLPSPPLNLHPSNYTTDTITLVWNPPLENPARVRYTIHYKQSGDVEYQNVYNIPMTNYRLSNLEQNTMYVIYVIATNQYGVSLPSEMIAVTTNRASAPVVTAIQDPPGYVHVGDSVSLNCNADSDLPIIDTFWTHRDFNQQGARVDLSSVNSDHVGRWTCHVKNQLFVDSTAHLILRVLDTPRASAVSAIEVATFSPLALYCNFTGFPQTIYWNKDSERFNTDGVSVSTQVSELQEEGILQAYLYIPAITSSDYATYTCVGQNRDLGSDEASIIVTRADDDTAVNPPLNIPNVHNVTQCCIEKNIRPGCNEMCTFDIDFTYLQDPAHLASCYDQIDELMECLANGRNTQQCCIRKGVPEPCLPFCYGERPADDVMDACLTHHINIADCMEQGHAAVPSSPRGVQLSVKNDGHITVAWRAPEFNADKVQYYEVNYDSPKSEVMNQHVPGSRGSVDLSGIHSSTRYTVTVAAVNHHGSSTPSEAVTIDTHDFQPSAPRNLLGKLFNHVYVRLNWDAPSNHPGGVVKYIVHYRLTGEMNYKEEFATSNTHRLDHLEANSKYDIYVTARSTTFTSPKSNIIIMTTESIDDGPNSLGSTENGGGGNNNTAVGLGVFFAVLLISAIGILGYFYYVRFYKAGRSLFKEDTVAFENPSYATAREAQVTGLPSFQETQPSSRDPNQNTMNSKTEGADLGYETLENNRTPKIGEAENNDFKYKTLHADPASVNVTMDKTQSTF